MKVTAVSSPNTVARPSTCGKTPTATGVGSSVFRSSPTPMGTSAPIASPARTPIPAITVNWER